MRRIFVLYSLLFLFLFCAVESFSRVVDEEATGVINQNSMMFDMCKGAYEQKVNECSSECAPSKVAEPRTCIDRCLKTAQGGPFQPYPNGFNTNISSYCLTSVYGPQCDSVGCIGMDSTSTKGRDLERSENEAQAAIPSPDDDDDSPPTPTSRPKDPVADDPPPTPSPRPTSTANWAQEANQDIQQCSSLQSAANTCCRNPTSCGGSLTDSQKASYAALVSQAQQAQNSGNAAGLEEICQRSKSLSVNSGNVNTGFANICYSKHSSCTQTCSAALVKWQQRLNNCGAGCDRSVASNAVNALLQRQNQCQSYAQLENQIRAQSSASADQANLAQICQNQTSLASTPDEVVGKEGRDGGGMLDQLGQGLSGSTAALGSLGGGAPAPAPTHEIGSPAEEYCQLNPNAPSCYVAPQFTGGEGSSPSLQQADGDGALSAEDFNVGDNIDGNSGKTYSAGGGIEPQPVQGHAITNGGAGGIPGGGSSASQNLASNNSEEGQNLPAMLGSGVNPNILHGEGGGGGYSNPVGSGSDGSGFNFKNRYGGFKFPKNAKGKNYKGLDLKKYLPGQRRGLAGLSAFHPDIGPKNVNFFHRVSTRMQALCKLKRLLGCE